MNSRGDTLLIPVLIVEDESLIRSLIANSLDWQELGFSIVGEAEDGEGALDLVETLRPRLVIVDINIPFINGLDFAERIRRDYPSVFIIILTGYEEFRYAQRAIKLGVLSYLLKPIDSNEMRESLLSARRAILVDEGVRYATMHKKTAPPNDLGANPTGREAKDQFLRTLIEGGSKLQSTEVEDRFRLYQFSIEPRNLLVCLFSELEPKSSDDSDELDSIASVLERLGVAGQLFTDGSGRVVLLVNEVLGEKNFHGRPFYRGCEEVQQLNRERGRAVPNVGIGTTALTPLELEESYRAAETACAQQFYFGQGKIFAYLESASQRPSEKRSFRSNIDHDRVMVLLRSAKLDELHQVFRELFVRLRSEMPRRQYCEMTVMEAVTIVMEYLLENAIDPPSVIEEASDALTSLQEMPTLRDMEQWLKGVVVGAVDKVRGGSGGRTQKIVAKTRHYIERNFRNPDLTLSLIADHISVTPSYISGVFKRRTGVSIVAYITDQRVRQARDLMDREPLLPVGDVAERVGFADPYYFSKVFRKHVGVSPSSYARGKRISRASNQKISREP
jgi:two-component system, response regulator YesN